jgi:hypothetical protein
LPPTKTWLFVQILQDDPPSLVGVDPAGQIWQAPLTLPRPETQLQDWVVVLKTSLVPHLVAQIPHWLVKKPVKQSQFLVVGL